MCSCSPRSQYMLQLSKIFFSPRIGSGNNDNTAIHWRYLAILPRWRLKAWSESPSAEIGGLEWKPSPQGFFSQGDSGAAEQRHPFHFHTGHVQPGEKKRSKFLDIFHFSKCCWFDAIFPRKKVVGIMYILSDLFDVKQLISLYEKRVWLVRFENVVRKNEIYSRKNIMPVEFISLPIKIKHSSFILKIVS